MKPQIYYSDGCVKSNEPLPARDVQVIVQPHPDVGIELVTGADYYIKLDDGTWRGVDIFGLFDYLIESGDVLFGRMMKTKEYQILLNQAVKDKELWLRRERRP